MSNNLNILVEAKKEYLYQLATVICPVMIDVFGDMYKEAQKISKGKKVLLKYQTLLKEVVNWNDVMVKGRTEEICGPCPWFSDLLAAVFVSHVKILASVKLNSESKKISIKLPANTMFTHTCYVNAAKDIYKDPYIMHDDMTDHEREEKLSIRLMKCIDHTIKELVPIRDILEANISQSRDNREVDIMSEAPEDTPDPDILDEEFGEELVNDEPEEELGVDMDNVPDSTDPVEVDEIPLGAEPDPEVIETKDIGLNNIKPQHADAVAEVVGEDEDEGVFFNDAIEAERKS